MKIKFYVLLAAMLLVVAGCSGGFGGGNARCAEGEFCRYYTGSQGVVATVENPPPMLFFRSSDAGGLEGNLIELNVKVENRGASDAIGAVFIENFGPDYYVDRIIDGQRSSITTGLQRGCSISFGNFGFLPLFAFNCGSTSANFYPGGGNVGFQLAPGVDVVFNWQDGKWQFQGNIDGLLINAMYHGAMLMQIVQNAFNFESLGGISYYLEGDNPTYPGGGVDYKQFIVQLREWPAGRDEMRMNYNLRNCFAYTTFASPMICIDPNPFSGDRFRTCQPDRVISMGTQGGPIAVTSVHQRNTGSSVILDFTIRNVGNGNVWELGSLERCSPYYPGTSLGGNFKDIVYVGYVVLENVHLDCTQRTIRLNNGEGRFTCTYNYANILPDAGTVRDVGIRESALRMELWYGYETVRSYPLTVRRLG